MSFVEHLSQMEEKSKPPWPSLVGCPRLMNVEENM
jgi:hypothetical protein